MPGGVTLPSEQPKSGWKVLVTCPHGEDFVLDLAYIRGWRRITDPCQMAEFERALKRKDRK